MRDADTDPHASSRPVELIGTLENINKAEKLIKDVIAEVCGLSYRCFLLLSSQFLWIVNHESNVVMNYWLSRLMLVVLLHLWLEVSALCRLWLENRLRYKFQMRRLYFLLVPLSFTFHALILIEDFLRVEEVIIFYSLVSMIEKDSSYSPLAVGWFNNWKRWGNYQEPSDKIRGTNSGIDNTLWFLLAHFGAK